MIIGIGQDMVDGRRITALCDRFGARFLDRIFTHKEQSYAKSGVNSDLSLAKRFAAKEAVAKALGRGIRGFLFRDIEVIHDDWGRPGICLYNGALSRLKAITPRTLVAHIHLSLSDEVPYALAMVVIESGAVIEGHLGSNIEPQI